MNYVIKEHICHYLGHNLGLVVYVRAWGVGLGAWGIVLGLGGLVLGLRLGVGYARGGFW